MKVYDSTMDWVAAIVRGARVEYNQLFEFLHTTREHDFLFGPDIAEYISDIYKKDAELHARAVVSQEKGTQKDIERQTELLTWFSVQLH